MGPASCAPASRQKAIVVLGATGTGKSALAVDLANIVGGEVVVADVMQLYQGLDMAGNKLQLEDQQGARKLPTCRGVTRHRLRRDCAASGCGNSATP